MNKTESKAAQAVTDLATRGPRKAPASGIVVATPPNPWAELHVSAAADWLTETPTPREYLMVDMRTGKGAVPASGVIFFGGAGGVGKSTFLLRWKLALATGTPLVGVLRPTKASRVLYITAEDETAEVRRRLFYAAREAGIETLGDGAIEVIDLHGKHKPLLDRDGKPTEHATTLIDYVKETGPYGAVFADPTGRIVGACIDKDNSIAAALVSVYEAIGTAAGGPVIAAHHTSQAARIAKTVDATALRGPGALGDHARMVLMLASERPGGLDANLAPRLGEIVTLSVAKTNYTSQWQPIRMRRGEHGELLPLDSYDLDMLAEARQAASPEARKKAAVESRVSELSTAVLDALRANEGGLSYRQLRDLVSATVGGCSDPKLNAAIASLGARVVIADGPRGSKVHHLAR